MQAVNLKVNELVNPVGINPHHLFLSWQCDGGVSQSAYEVRWSADSKNPESTGKIQSTCMHHKLNLDCSSRQRVIWSVRLYNEQDRPGVWSEPAFFEIGLLKSSDWQAQWITPELKPLEKKAPHQPAGYLKQEFEMPHAEKSRLYVTAHGCYEVYLNGKRVGTQLLTPGPSAYQDCLPVLTYDSSDLLKQGRNEIVAVLGDGWYRSDSGVTGDRNLYGSDLSFLLQLEADGKTVLKTDDSWQGSSSGPIRMNDMQQGEQYDARMETITEWHAVRTESFGYDNLCGSQSQPVTAHESFTGKRMMTPDGSAVYDFGQNLAGVVEVELDAHAGDTIEIIHAEALDEHGNATTANYQPGDRHQEGGIQQKVTYICKEGHNHYQPFFTIMGFRYIKVNTAADLSSAVFTAHAIYSDMKETASFRCSNQDLNQLFKNSVWSMKSNFCYIPTDCPTRERAGWTGDAGVFISTGLRLMDSFPVFRKWLNDCRLNQHEDGRISNIAPQNGKPGMFTQLLSGSVGWGDACILVPYAMYEYTGDRSILSENYEMMQKWYGYLSDRAKKKPIKQIFRNDADEQYVIDTGIDYGEWCEPGVGTEAMGKPGQSVGTAFFAYSGRLLGRIAEILDHPEDAKQYREISEHARNAWYHRFTDHGMIHSDRQAEYVRALKFELLNETDAIAAAKTLNELVILNGYHLNTGFLSTPYLCEMLTKYGYIATAEKVLMQDTQPSWLYEVKKGATTVWERWDGIDTDGKVTGSLNHYSYGAISGWLLNSVCGIQYSFEQTVIHPLIELHLEYAEGSIDTPQGTVKCGWKKQSGKIHISCSIPSGMNAEIILPENLRKQVTAGQYEFDLSGK